MVTTGQAAATGKRRAALVFNPRSGPDGGADAAQTVERLSSFLDVTLYETTPERGGDACARAALAEGVDMVIAAGGDGTVSQVASVLVGSDVVLGVIARGTSNSFAGALGIPATFDEACDLLRDGTPRRLDSAVCSGRTMVLHATVGAHADVIATTAREAKNRWGALAYVAKALEKVAALEPFEVELETDAHVIRCRAVVVTVANVAPTRTLVAQGPAHVEGDDALLDVTIVAASNLLEAVAAGAHLLRTALTAEPAERDDIGYLACQRVKITTSTPQPLLIDGEASGTTPTLVEIVPHSLVVIAPEPTEHRRGPQTKLAGLPDLAIEPR